METNMKHLYNVCRHAFFSDIATLVTCSDIYINEFFMYIAIKTYISDIIIIPFLEVYNIFNEIIKNKKLIEQIQDTIYNNTHNIITLNKIKIDINLKNGQENLKKKIKEIFNHDILSEFIKKININIIDNKQIIKISCYNNENIQDLKNILNLNIKNYVLKYNTFILKDDKTLDFYNICENSNVHIIRIQRG